MYFLKRYKYFHPIGEIVSPGFYIELTLGTMSMSRALYRMSTSELMESKDIVERSVGKMVY